MPATLRVSDVPNVVAALIRLRELDGARDTQPELTPEEISEVWAKRRERLLRELANKGIEVKADQVPTQVIGLVNDLTNEESAA